MTNTVKRVGVVMMAALMTWTATGCSSADLEESQASTSQALGIRLEIDGTSVNASTASTDGWTNETLEDNTIRLTNADGASVLFRNVRDEAGRLSGELRAPGDSWRPFALDGARPAKAAPGTNVAPRFVLTAAAATLIGLVIIGGTVITLQQLCYWAASDYCDACYANNVNCSATVSTQIRHECTASCSATGARSGANGASGFTCIPRSFTCDGGGKAPEIAQGPEAP